MVVNGVVVAGYGVASGQSTNDSSSGTILLQKPYFLARGLDLRHCFNGTINIDIRPLELVSFNGDYRFVNLKWHPDIDAENFSFIRCLLWYNCLSYRAYVYYPHPETKPNHVQPKSVLEIIAPAIPDLAYDAKVRLEIPEASLVFNTCLLPNSR